MCTESFEIDKPVGYQEKSRIVEVLCQAIASYWDAGATAEECARAAEVEDRARAADIRARVVESRERMADNRAYTAEIRTRAAEAEDRACAADIRARAAEAIRVVKWCWKPCLEGDEDAVAAIDAAAETMATTSVLQATAPMRIKAESLEAQFGISRGHAMALCLLDTWQQLLDACNAGDNVDTDGNNISLCDADENVGFSGGSNGSNDICSDIRYAVDNARGDDNGFSLANDDDCNDADARYAVDNACIADTQASLREIAEMMVQGACVVYMGYDVKPEQGLVAFKQLLEEMGFAIKVEGT